MGHTLAAGLLLWCTTRLWFFYHTTLDMSGKFTAFCFGIVTLIYTSYHIIYYPYIYNPLLVSLGISYYLNDLVWLMFQSQKGIFILHHVITLVPLSVFWRYPIDGTGNLYFYIIFFLAEITNPVQQIFMLIRKYYNRDDKYQQHLFFTIYTFYTWFYILVRGILWPALFIFWWRNETLSTLDPPIDSWKVSLCYTVFLCLILGSFQWSSQLYKGWSRFRISKTLSNFEKQENK